MKPLQHKVKLQPDVTTPRKFADYEVSVDREQMPEKVYLTQLI